MRSPSLGCIPEPRNYAREARTTSDASSEKPRRRNEIRRLTGYLLRRFLCAAGATLRIAETAMSAQEMASPPRYFGSLPPAGRRLHASQRPVPSPVPANGWPALPRGTSATCTMASTASASRQHPIRADGVPRCPGCAAGCAEPYPNDRLPPRDENLAVPLTGAARDAAGAHLPSRRRPCWKRCGWMTRGWRSRPRRQSLPIPAASIHAASASALPRAGGFACGHPEGCQDLVQPL